MRSEFANTCSIVATGADRLRSASSAHTWLLRKGHSCDADDHSRSTEQCWPLTNGSQAVVDPAIAAQYEAYRKLESSPVAPVPEVAATLDRISDQSAAVADSTQAR